MELLPEVRFRPEGAGGDYILSGKIVSNNTGVPKQGVPIYAGDLSRTNALRFMALSDSQGKFIFMLTPCVGAKTADVDYYLFVGEKHELLLQYEIPYTNAHRFEKVLDEKPPFPFTPAGATNDLKWGDPVGGLQMAVLVEANVGFVHCWIRNAGTNEITYSSCSLGYFGSVGLEYYDGTNWTRPARRASEPRYYHGVGPSLHYVKRLGPLEVISGAANKFQVRDRYGPLIAVTNNGRVVQTQAGRSDLPLPRPLGATIGVDLADFEWPTGVLSKPLQIRISQQMFGPVNNEETVVISPPVFLEGPLTEAFLQKLRNNKE